MRYLSPPGTGRLRAVVAAIVCLAAAWAAAPASAVVSDVQLIDGPSTDVTDVADAAMAEDGTGGVVYLKRVDGRNHVFVAQFRNGWRAPQRVDAGQNFDSSWPRIGAGDGGRLVVTWVHEFGVETDRMFSAKLDPGATGFQKPTLLDLNLGEATSTFPDLDMNRGGQAYLTYLVVTDTSPANPPGYIGANIRIARYNNRLWSVAGTPIDRNISTPMRAPTEGSAPKVGIDVQGQGIVAWQEPDDEFVDRIWARRLFGSNSGVPQQVSPSTWDGAPLRGAADAFSLDVAGFGQGGVAWRQQPGQASKLDAPRIMINEIPDIFSETSGKFGDARLADGGTRGSLEPPNLAVDPRGLYLNSFGAAGTPYIGTGDDIEAGPVKPIGRAGSSTTATPAADLAETGAGVVAWRYLAGSTGLVGVQELRADGVDETTDLSAPRGGAIGRLVFGGSGLGDAIVAWQQGTGARSQVAAAVVDAPPDPFLVLLPFGWQGKEKTRISWDPSPHAIGGVKYSVSVDDEPVINNVSRTSAKLTPDDIGNGPHQIQVFAIDSGGQETGSKSARILIDRKAPRVSFRKRGRRVVVRLIEGSKKMASGLKPSSVRLKLGDGERSKVAYRRKPGTASASHVYERPGTYRIRIVAADRAKNRVVRNYRVKIR